MKKRTILLLFFLFCVQMSTFAQSDSFQEYVNKQRQAQAAYIRNEQENFKKYRDSLNRKFAEYLTKEWKDFDLQKSEPPIKEPIRIPPIFDVTVPRPVPNQLPLVMPQPTPAPQPQPMPQPEPPTTPVPPVDRYPLKIAFFGTSIALKEIPELTIRLPGVSEKDIADYWATLSELPHYTSWVDEALRLKNELRLNDWGVVQLLNQLFAVYCPQGSENEQVVFSVFLLNQLGYRAKIGRNGHELMPMIAFRQVVYNTTYFMNNKEEEVRYTVVNPKHRDLSEIQTCPMDYEGANNTVNMDMAEPPRFAVNLQTKTLLGKPVQYNKNTTDFCATYPCVEFSVYADAALDATLWKSIEAQVALNVRNKSQEEAVNWLLHFVQNAFPYKTDEEQFGYEKWFFAEETVAAAFSDCEDRSILFAQLVRRLLHMQVLLVHYPDIHLATAVKFRNSSTNGDYIVVDGEKYLICDPTYINAKLGMSMPKLRNVSVKILKLKP